MLRVVRAPGDRKTHIENRIGEPAANLNLCFAPIICGADDMERRLVPLAAVDTPYDVSCERLPRNSDLFRFALEGYLVDYFSHIKELELNRFLGENVTDWEQREYIANF